jgi:membrane protein
MDENTSIINRIKLHCESVVQRVWISFQLYGKNGLANHAAAGAYGFLLAAVPALLMVAFILSITLRSSPEMAAQFITQIDFLEDVFDIRGLVKNFLAMSRTGLAGLMFVISTFWSALLFAPSLQRGLKVIFFDSEKERLTRTIFVMLVLECSVIVFAFIMVFSSQLAILIHHALYLFPIELESVSRLVKTVLPLLSLGLFCYIAYRMVPSPRPSRIAGLAGALICVAAFGVLSLVFRLVLNTARYYALYGSLAGLIILLVNVYFFFVFFFFGAEMTFVIEAFDALLFVKIRQIQARNRKRHKNHSLSRNRGIEQMIFASADGHLLKYIRSYQQGAIIFHRGEQSNDVYYILSGTVGIYLTESAPWTEKIGTIRQDNFFGEMGHVLSQGRSATIIAESDVVVMALPPAVFSRILKIDQDTDGKVIRTLSERLKNADEQRIRANTFGTDPEDES